VTTTELLWDALAKVALILAFISLNALFLIWAERKVSGFIQRRLGPVRVGRPHGFLQTIADVIKLLSKEDVVPGPADRLLFILAPVVFFLPAVLVYVVVPIGPRAVISDLNIGILYVIAVTSVGVLSIFMAGWGSNNKWALLGSMRAAAALIAYEVPVVLSVIGVIMLAGSLSLQDVIRAQDGLWFILLQPLGFMVYIIGSLAELSRIPFDLNEAESELVAGFNVEYSGLRWALFFLVEYSNIVVVSAVGTALFLGGWRGPFLPPVVWFLLKTYLLVFVIMWIRWTLPRLRIDQLTGLAWKFLIPVALVNIGITGLILL